MHCHNDKRSKGIISAIGVLQVAMTVKKVCKQVRVKKFVPNKKGDIGMEVYYLCQPNTYVIAREFGEQQ